METTAGISVPTGKDILSMLVSSSGAWIDRSAEGKKVVEHILSSPAPIIVFSGRTGCGKTELFERSVLPSLPADQNIFYARRFDTPPALQRRGNGEAEFWSATTSPGIIVLDQLEGLFAKDPSVRLSFLQQLSERMSSGRFEAVLVLVLAEENLSDLFSLREYLPHVLDDLSKIGGVPAEKLRSALRGLSAEHGLQIEDAVLRKLVDDLRKPAASKYAVSPELLAALVFQTWRSNSLLEKEMFGLDEYTAAGELDGMLEGYLEYRLDAVEDELNRRLTAAILKEVVFTARAGNAPDFDDVGRRLDATKTQVMDVLGSLLDQDPKVLRETDPGRYEVIPAQLTPVVNERIERDRQRTQSAQSLLRQAVRVFRERGVPLSEPEFTKLHRQRSSLRVTEEEARLMLGCALVYEDPHLEAATQHWLRRAGDETAKVEILLGGVFDPRDAVRERAAAVLAGFNRPEVQNQLYLLALKDPKDAVRDRAIESLSAMRDEPLRQSLFKEIRDPNSPNPGNAVSALRIFPDKITADYVGNLVTKASPSSTRDKAIQVLGDLGIPEALDVLLRVAVQDEDKGDRSRAAEVLGSRRGASLIDLLQKLQDESRLLQQAQGSLEQSTLVVRLGTFALAAIVIFLNLFFSGLILCTLRRRLKLGLGFFAVETLAITLITFSAKYSNEEVGWAGVAVWFLAMAASQLAATWIVLQEKEPAGETRSSYIASLRLGLFLANAVSFFLVIHGLAHIFIRRFTRGVKLFTYEVVGSVLLVYAFLFDRLGHQRFYRFYLVAGIALFAYSYLVDVVKVLLHDVVFKRKYEFRQRIAAVCREVMKNPEACQVLLRSLQGNQTKVIRRVSRILTTFTVESQPLVAPFKELWRDADAVTRRRMTSVLAAHHDELSVKTLHELTAETRWAGRLTYLWCNLRYRVWPTPLLRVAVLGVLVLVGALSVYEDKLGPELRMIRKAALLKDKHQGTQVRAGAAMELASADAKVAFDAVKVVLDRSDEQPAVKMEMLPILAQIAEDRSSNYPKQAEEVLAGLARDRQVLLDLRKKALQELKSVAVASEVPELRDESISILYELLKNSDEARPLREVAVDAFKKIGTPRACDTLRAFVILRPAQEGLRAGKSAKAPRAASSDTTLDEAERDLRQQALVALTQISEGSIQLQSALDPYYAFQILQSMAENSDKHFDPRLRKAAQSQLARIDPLALAQFDLNQYKYRSAIERASVIVRSEPDPWRSNRAQGILQDSYYGLIQPPYPSGLWDDIVKDLKGVKDLKKQGCYALAMAYYNIGVSQHRFEEAAAELASLQPRCLDSIQPSLNLAAVHHDELAPTDPSFYAKAYEDLSPLPLRATTEDERISAKANLAEASLTTGLYSQTQNLGDDVLKSQVLTQNKVLQLNLRFLIFASLVFQNNTQGSDKQLKDTLALYQSLPEGLYNDWDFRGTINYVNQSKLSVDQKTLLLSTIDLIAGAKSQQKLDHFHAPALGSTRAQ